MRRMEKVTGRSDDMLIIRGVNVFPSQIEELILEDSRLSPHYVLELHRDNHLDALTVVVEIKSENAGAMEEIEGPCAKDLAHRVKSYTGVSVGARIVPVGGVERSMGKAKRVIDLRDPK
jgi:phenylacetate-CoA ligase